jgi:predicted alpha/beta-fold hydrolase
MDTPDGDFLDLDWCEPEPSGAPVVVVLHGLEGSSRSHYVSGLCRETAALGLRAVILNFRSCSGELNRTARLYHSGETSDLDAVLGRLIAREPAVRVGLVGISLGGNVLLKWLGERGSGAPAEVVGAVAISVPFDLAACARVLDQAPRRWVYTANFMRTMRAKVIDKAARNLGSPLTAPFMTLSFMALLVIPQLKLSDKGLFDGEKFEFTPLLQ